MARGRRRVGGGGEVVDGVEEHFGGQALGRVGENYVCPWRCSRWDGAELVGLERTMSWMRSFMSKPLR